MTLALWKPLKLNFRAFLLALNVLFLKLLRSLRETFTAQARLSPLFFFYHHLVATTFSDANSSQESEALRSLLHPMAHSREHAVHEDPHSIGIIILIIEFGCIPQASRISFVFLETSVKLNVDMFSITVRHYDNLTGAFSSSPSSGPC